MDLATYWLRAALRRRWRVFLALGLLVGVAGGGVTAALAGARRTDSAYRRFTEENLAWDATVQVTCDPAAAEGVDVLVVAAHAVTSSSWKGIASAADLRRPSAGERDDSTRRSPARGLRSLTRSVA